MKSKGWNVVANIVIGCLCLVFVVLFFVTVKQFADAGRVYTRSEDSMVYYIQNGDYESMLRGTYMNEIHGVWASDTMKECYAVAHYYEAATLYKAYEKAGKNELAAEKKKSMEEQEALMGELSFAAEDIREELGIGEE